MASGNRRLFFYGFLFFALAPITGFLILAPLPNARAMMGLHIALWISGAIVCAAAAAWPHVALGPRTAKLCERGLVLGLACGIPLDLIRIFANTPTLFAGGGTVTPPWAEVAMMVLQLAITFTLVPALIGIAVGLGRKAA